MFSKCALFLLAHTQSNVSSIKKYLSRTNVFAKICILLTLLDKCGHTNKGSLRIDPITRWKQGKGMTFFDESRKLRFGVLPRDNPTLDKVVWVTTDSTGHAWHTISAWDNDDGVMTAK